MAPAVARFQYYTSSPGGYPDYADDDAAITFLRPRTGNDLLTAGDMAPWEFAPLDFPATTKLTALFTGSVVAPSTGYYFFRTYADDRARLYVDDQRVTSTSAVNTWVDNTDDCPVSLLKVRDARGPVVAQVPWESRHSE